MLHKVTQVLPCNTKVTVLGVIAIRDTIEINKDLVPYSFNILLADEWFELFIDYNKTADLFTVGLYRNSELVCSEAIVLNEPLFRDVYQPKEFPAVTITPHDPSGVATMVTHENLGESVFLTIDDEGDEDG